MNTSIFYCMKVLQYMKPLVHQGFVMLHCQLIERIVNVMEEYSKISKWRYESIRMKDFLKLICKIKNILMIIMSCLIKNNSQYFQLGSPLILVRFFLLKALVDLWSQCYQCGTGAIHFCKGPDLALQFIDATGRFNQWTVPIAASKKL